MRILMRALVVSALAIAFIIGTAQVAQAYVWDVRYSYYDGKVVVKARGNMYINQNGSNSFMVANDSLNDGNRVYAYTHWKKLSQRCAAFGVSNIITATTSTCRTVGGNPIRKDTGYAPNNGRIERTRYQPFCDQNGNNCAHDGFQVVAAGCADMGQWLPDSCTYAYVEYHRK